MFPKTPLVAADRTRRRLLLSVLLIGGLLGAWALYGFQGYLHGLMRSDDTQAFIHLFRLLQLLLSGLALATLGLGGWLLWLARRILRAGQFPLPNQTVARAILLRTGVQARRLAWAVATMGLILLILATLMVYLIVQLLPTFQAFVPDLALYW